MYFMLIALTYCMFILLSYLFIVYFCMYVCVFSFFLMLPLLGE